MSFKLRKLATNMNVIINMVIIKNMVRIVGKDKLQGNGAFNETGKLLHIHSLLPHHVAMAYIFHQPALETTEKGFGW